MDESQRLVQGVERHGGLFWSQILADGGFNNRTQIDLKDRFRNMLKQVTQPGDYRPPLPPELKQRVLRLYHLHVALDGTVS